MRRAIPEVRINEVAVGGSGEEIVARMVGFTLAGGVLRKENGFLLGDGVCFAAGLLQRREGGRVLLDGAMDALLVEGNEGEEFRLLDPGRAFGEGVIDFGVAGLRFRRRGG